MQSEVGDVLRNEDGNSCTRVLDSGLWDSWILGLGGGDLELGTGASGFCLIIIYNNLTIVSMQLPPQPSIVHFSAVIFYMYVVEMNSLTHRQVGILVGYRYIPEIDNDWNQAQYTYIRRVWFIMYIEGCGTAEGQAMSYNEEGYYLPVHASIRLLIL